MSLRRGPIPLLLPLVIALAGCAEEPTSTADATPDRPTPRPTPTLTPTSTPTISPTPTVATTSAPTAAPVVLALGDSVTSGVGVSDPHSEAFPALVAGELEAEARVLAVPGETAAGFLERRIDDAESAIQELGTRITAVTIGLGANEILRIRRDPACIEDRHSPACQLVATDAAEGAASALDSVVERVEEALAEAGSDAPILVLAYYNPDVDPIATSTIVGADGVVGCTPDDPAPGLNDRIACVAERREVVLADLYSAFLGREDELTGIGHGDVHPTAEGHRVIADAILDAFRSTGSP